MDSITPHCAAVSINKAVFTADSGPLRVARASAIQCESCRVGSSGRVLRLESRGDIRIPLRESLRERILRLGVFRVAIMKMNRPCDASTIFRMMRSRTRDRAFLSSALLAAWEGGRGH